MLLMELIGLVSNDDFKYPCLGTFEVFMDEKYWNHVCDSSRTKLVEDMLSLNMKQ